MSDGAEKLRKAAQEWYRKGTEAMQRENWDFAVECYNNAIKMQPDNVMFRQVKNGCSRKQYGDNGSGARMASMKLIAIRGKIKKAAIKKEWKTVCSQAEEGLSVNPWDTSLLFELGKAARQLEWDDVAKFALSQAVRLDKDSIDFNRCLGELLRERGEYDDARRCYKRIYDLDPSDGEARSIMAAIDAEKVEDRGGYGTATSTQNVKVPDQPEQRASEYDSFRKNKGQDSVAPGESEETDLKHAIRKDGKNIALYLKLAHLQRGERKLKDALQTIEQAIQIDSADKSLTEQKEDIEIEILKERVSEAQERAVKFPDRENLKAKVKKLSTDLIKMELDMLTARVENHPNDMKIKVELADRLRQTKQFKKAIPLLQQASADSRLQANALVSLGECFVRTGQMNLGKRQFDKALELINGKDNADAFKNAHYYLGRIYEKAQQNDKAEHHYSEILGADYEYRDVAARLEELQGGDEFEDFADL